MNLDKFFEKIKEIIKQGKLEIAMSYYFGPEGEGFYIVVNDDEASCKVGDICFFKEDKKFVRNNIAKQLEKIDDLIEYLKMLAAPFFDNWEDVEWVFFEVDCEKQLIEIKEMWQ